MKRIVTIQDISCLGKCSLTVALPIISAMGVECAIIPTAVLSTHTMFKNFTFHDLTQEIEPIVDHWKKEEISFDAVYTGYLGSFEQIEIVSGVFEKLKEKGSLICVDPAMADNGKLYPAFDEAFALKMAELCANADYVLPNITEAAFMTGTEYKERYDEEYVRTLILALADKGARNVILTGVSFEEGKTGAMSYSSAKGEFSYYCHEKLPVSYHGTGDIFSSAFVGALMNGHTPYEAVAVAADYTAECIRVTLGNGKEKWYGVDFEECIPYLVKRMEM
ncbi:MAG: pyridoxamine kinase [Ruminococcaceae bacterium]|nr:pyridoxamine kinase [Oscillospiraceae bacterium]